MKLDFLRKIGLSAGETKIYGVLSQVESAGLSVITEKTGLERRYIYDILNKLIDKGLVSYTQENNRKKFRITHPKMILSYLEEKRTVIEDLEKEIAPNLKPLVDLFNAPKTQVGAQIFRGSEGIKSLLNEVLEYKESFWLGGNNFNQQKNVPKNLVTWFSHWMKKRAKLKHLMYDLVDEGSVAPGVFLHVDDQKKNYIKVQRMPKHLKNPMVIIIFGSKVAQILWGEQSFAFVLESKEIRDSYMQYFNYFWKDPW